MARPIARLKLGYYPLPIEEAQNIRSLLVSEAPYAAIDPCAGDGTALLEITKDTEAHLAAIELDSDRAAAAAREGNCDRSRQRLRVPGLGGNMFAPVPESAIRHRVWSAQ